MTREYRILALAGALFVLGALFFFLRMPPRELPAGQNFAPDRSGRTSRLHLPAPEQYETFRYEAGAQKAIAVTCSDTYYTIIVFEAGVDYRTHPSDARYNVATPCVSPGEQQVVLKDLPLVAGREYYIVRAHQGSAGEWYNPY